MIDLIEFTKTVKGKRDREFLELFYNKNFHLETENLHFINSAFKFKNELNLDIKRKDYSSIHVIKQGVKNV